MSPLNNRFDNTTVNAKRLFAALEWSKARDLEPPEPITVEQAIEQLKEKLGIVEEEVS